MESNTELALPVASSETNNLLNSFRINVSEDQRQPSFAKHLLSAIQCHEIENEIHSLSNREVVLHKNVLTKTDHAKPEPIHYFEVEVICTKGTLKVNEKVCCRVTALTHLGLLLYILNFSNYDLVSSCSRMLPRDMHFLIQNRKTH